MEPKRVEITFSKDGSVRIEAFGFVGQSCKEATKFLEKIFPMEESSSTALKESYYQEEEIANGLPSGYCG